MFHITEAMINPRNLTTQDTIVWEVERTSITSCANSRDRQILCKKNHGNRTGVQISGTLQASREGAKSRFISSVTYTYTYTTHFYPAIIVPRKNASTVRSILFATTLHFRKPIERPLHLDEPGGYQEKRDTTRRRYPLFAT